MRGVLFSRGETARFRKSSHPPNRLFAALNNVYCRSVLPLIGGLLTGQRDAYRYLPESVRKFPAAGELADEMRSAGFQNVSFEYLTGGTVALHVAQRGSAP